MSAIKLLACVTVLAIPSAVSAVCLLGDYTVEAEYSRSAAVVVAKVMSERTVPDPEDSESYGGTIYTVKVLESFRGALHGTSEIYSENSSGRFPMERGKKYILFLYRYQGQFSADNCGNSGPVAQKQEVLAAVRSLTKPNQTGQKPNCCLKPTASVRVVQESQLWRSPAAA